MKRSLAIAFVLALGAAQVAAAPTFAAAGGPSKHHGLPASAAFGHGRGGPHAAAGVATASTPAATPSSRVSAQVIAAPRAFPSVAAPVALVAPVVEAAPAPARIATDQTIVVVVRVMSAALPAVWNRAVLPALWLLLAGLLCLFAVLYAQQRRTVRRMLALDDARTQLLRVASHELRTPLTVIRGYLSLAAEGALGDLPAELKAVLPGVARKSTEMADMVEKMLLAARIDAGDLRPALVLTDLAQLARVAATEVAHRHPAGRVFLTAEGEVPAVAAVDPDLCKQAIANLVENALTYSPAMTEVAVRVRRDGDQCVIEVLDRGPGIPASRRHQLFTRFARDAEGDSVTGAGLGLWLAAEVARACGGRAGYRPREDGGSEFSLRFPAAGWTRSA